MGALKSLQGIISFILNYNSISHQDHHHFARAVANTDLPGGKSQQHVYACVQDDLSTYTIPDFFQELNETKRVWLFARVPYLHQDGVFVDSSQKFVLLFVSLLLPLGVFLSI